MSDIRNLLDPKCIVLDMKATSKIDAITELCEALYHAGRARNADALKDAVLEREAQIPTGIGMGIAIPHGKSDSVVHPSVAFGRSKTGVDFGAADGVPADLIFLLAVPGNAAADHLAILANLARSLLDESFRLGLRTAQSAKDVLEVMSAVLS
jgi:fructose-specific phosphotransferase system IIA component